jgi:hypothetical protein
MKTMMNGRLAKGLTGLLLATLGAMQGVSGAQAPPPKKSPYIKLGQPWPDAEQLRRRRTNADNLPLFNSTDPITFTIAGDIKTVNKDRDQNSAKQYPAEVRIARDEGKGKIDGIPVKLAARGHLRRMARTCDSVPLRVEFDKDRIKDTIFAGQSVLKLVVQCAGGGEYEQYLLREYLAYRIFNLLTPRSFRARLAKITYVDSANDKAVATRLGMFLEDDGDVARRMEGRTVNLPRGKFSDVDSDTLALMMVFEYMIGNTDVSLYALHNLVLVQMPDQKLLYPVPYDFDVSGLVHPPYAIPARGLTIKSVVDRLYRGSCMTTPEQIEPTLANFNAKKDLVMALPDAIAWMDKTSREDAKTYLNSFYSSIKNANDVKRLFLDKKAKGGCTTQETM